MKLIPLIPSRNLADLTNVVTARSNLGLGTLATQSGTFSGTSSGTNTGDNAVNTTSNAYADSLVVGLVDDRGNYDASVNTFPASGGSGTAGAILKGDLWTISVAGTLGGTAVTAGDLVRALVDTPGQTASNWAVTENNIGYVAEPAIAAGTTAQYWRGDKSWQTLNATAVGLSNVENTALSTWAGSANLTTLGTIASGVWNGTAIAVANGGTGATTAAAAATALGLGTGDSPTFTAVRSDTIANATPTTKLTLTGTTNLDIVNTTNVRVINNSGYLGFGSSTPDVGIARPAVVGVLRICGTSSANGGVLNFIERTAPSAPAANGVYIYAEDNGAGKTRLMALFATGAAQQIAIEP